MAGEYIKQCVIAPVIVYNVAKLLNVTNKSSEKRNSMQSGESEAL